MRKLLLLFMFACVGAFTLYAQSEYSTLVVKTKSGQTLEVWLKHKPQVKVTDTELVITCGDEVTGYIHDEIDKFYFIAYDAETGVDEPMAENVVRITYLDESKVVVSGVNELQGVVLYGLDGRRIAAETEFEDDSVSVSLASLLPGTYILRISESTSFKLLKR